MPAANPMDNVFKCETIATAIGRSCDGSAGTPSSSWYLRQRAFIIEIFRSFAIAVDGPRAALDQHGYSGVRASDKPGAVQIIAPD